MGMTTTADTTIIDAALLQLIEQTTRPFTDDDSCAFCPPGEHFGIDALLIGHRNDQQHREPGRDREP